MRYDQTLPERQGAWGTAIAQSLASRLHGILNSGESRGRRYGPVWLAGGAASGIDRTRAGGKGCVAVLIKLGLGRRGVARFGRV